jgi:hypothetical protein
MSGPSEAIFVPTKIRVARSVTFRKDISTATETAYSAEPEDLIEVHRFATTPASVHLGIDLKKNKDYCSAGIMVNATIPCYVEEIPLAFQKAYELIMERLMVELPKIVKAAYDLRDARIEGREPKAA